MRHRIQNLKAIWLASAAVMAVPAGPALAQSGAADASKTAEIEEVIVTGIRQSIASAIEIKRDSDVIMDTISAEDIGKLPDQNISETLSRIPGVQISRVEGEGTAINVRGIDLNRLELNGKSFVGSAPNGDPATSDISPEMLSSVEIIKSPSADLTEGWLGAIVNLKTKRPLDLSRGIFSFRAQGAHADKAEKIGGKASAFWADNYFDGKLGVLLGVTANRFYGRTDQYSSGGWTQTSAIDVTGDGVGDANLFRPNRLQAWGVTRKDDRWAVNGTLQWRPIEPLTITLDGLKSHKTVDRTRFVEQVILNNNYTNAHALADGTIDRGTVSGVTLRPLIYDGDSESSTEAWNFTAEYKTAKWKLSIDASDSSGDGEGADGNDPTNPGYAGVDGVMVARQIAGNVVNASYDTNGGAFAPNYQVATNFNRLDPAQYEIFTIVDSQYQTHNKGRDVAADATYYFDSGLLTALKVGARREHTSVTTGGAAIDSAIIPGLLTSGDPTPANSLRGNELPGLSYGGLISDLFEGEGGDLPRSILGGGLDMETIRRTLGYALSRPNSFLQGVRDVDQKTTAFYVRADYAGELFDIPYSGNFGVRHVTGDRESSGYSLAGATLLPVSKTKSFKDTLPSFNLTVEPRSDVMVRFAAAKVMARPPLNQTGVGVNLNPVSNTGSAGNPDLEPFKATQYDASVEWYFAPASMVSLALFKKDVSAFTTIVQVSEDHPEAPNNTTGSTLYLVNRPTNGAKGEVHGFELNLQQALSFLPAPFDALGYSISYTYAPSETPNIDELTGKQLPLPNSSENSYNLVAYYDGPRFSARVAYNHRSEYLLIQQGRSSGGSMFAKERGQIDISATYKLTEHFKINLEGVNLGKDVKTSYVGTSNRVFNSWQDDRRIYLGVSATF